MRSLLTANIGAFISVALIYDTLLPTVCRKPFYTNRHFIYNQLFVSAKIRRNIAKQKIMVTFAKYPIPSDIFDGNYIPNKQ
jgi:hypothetical protein